jgi:glycosyltransferase involved in cell wall biosynthesis
MAELVICCSDSSDPNWRWIERSLSASEFRFKFISCAPQSWLEAHFKILNLSRLRGCFQAVREAHREQALLLVTHGPALAAWCGAFGFFYGLRSCLLAHSFNFTSLPGKLKTIMFKLCLRRADRIVTFSNVERELYSRAFQLSKDRFDFVYWGVKEPVTSDRNEQGDYVSSIGGNARDYATLMEAARRLPYIPFIVVGRPENFIELNIPQNVKTHVNTPLDFAMSTMKHSRFTVLPLIGSEVPCGHVTLVAAMHLGKAIIVTDSSGVEDYVMGANSALVCPVKDPEAMSKSILKLWEDSILCAALGESGKAFAIANCSEQSIVDHFCSYVRTIKSE